VPGLEVKYQRCIMKAMKCGLAGLLLAAGGLGLTGCGGNPNEKEYAEHAPPGKPFEDPNDSKVSYRRARTLNVPKQYQKKIARPDQASP
jgi:hypothetical protein